MLSGELIKKRRPEERRELEGSQEEAVPYSQGAQKLRIKNG